MRHRLRNARRGPKGEAGEILFGRLVFHWRAPVLATSLLRRTIAQESLPNKP
jgi:hypothetical protein